MRVQANPTALAAYGLSLDDLRTAIGNANSNQSKGSFDGPTRASTIEANAQLRTADEFKSMIVTYRNGAPIRLSEVAERMVVQKVGCLPVVGESCEIVGLVTHTDIIASMAAAFTG